MREVEWKGTQGGIKTTFSKKRKDMVSLATGCFQNVQISPSNLQRYAEEKKIVFIGLTLQS